jgi:hypothetical protein
MVTKKEFEELATRVALLEKAAADTAPKVTLPRVYERPKPEKPVKEPVCPQCKHEMQWHGGSGCMPPEVAQGRQPPCGCRRTIYGEATSPSGTLTSGSLIASV